MGKSYILLYVLSSVVRTWNYSVILVPNITVKSSWAWWRFKSPASPFFAQQLVQAQIKENSKVRVTGLCEGNPPVTGRFVSQRACNAENISIWWRHHEYCSSRISNCQLRDALFKDSDNCGSRKVNSTIGNILYEMKFCSKIKWYQ